MRVTVNRAISLAMPLALAACASAPRPAAVQPTPPMPAVGLDRVVGRTATQLVQLFGEPDQDLREGTARRLQFTGAVCVLDAYLYPPARGGEAVTTYLDARLPNGEDIDRASCVAALSRRRAAR